jgi:two-component system NarL family sensor kinase
MPSNEKELVFAVFISAITFFLLASLIVLLVYNYFRVKSLKQKEILKAVFEAQEAERTRISEDLHDDVGGKLSALKLQNELVIAEGLTEPGMVYANKNANLIDVIVKDIRRIVRNQASKYLIENGLSHELLALSNQYRILTGMDIDIHFDEDKLRLRPDFMVTLFRMLQELLHNSVKHSEATHILIRIAVNQGRLEVYFSDNGKGFSGDEIESTGMGLKNIRTRATLYNGSVSFLSIPRKETSYSFVFDLRETSL